MIALGFFDGVHIGHGALLRLTRERASALGCTASALTFDAHPDTVIFGTPIPLIGTMADRERLMRRRVPFFSLKLVYEGDRLESAVLDGERLR